MSEGIVGRILGWLRAGYPEGVPAKDYVPLLALLHRTLSEAEYCEVIRYVDEEHLDPVRVADIRAAIEQVAHVVPNEDELREVAGRLAAAGMPLSASAHRLAEGAAAGASAGAEAPDADAGGDADRADAPAAAGAGREGSAGPAPAVSPAAAAARGQTPAAGTEAPAVAPTRPDPDAPAPE